MRGHPSKYALFAHAESLVDRDTAVSATTAAHVARCRACAREVAAIRASLDFASQAPALNPTEDLTARILFSAQDLQRTTQTHPVRGSFLATLAKGIGAAAAVLIVAALYFSAALNMKNAGHSMPAAPALSRQRAEIRPSRDVLRRTTTHVNALAAAVNTPSKNPPTLWEREYRRTAHVLAGDIAAARTALERNPGCTRASELVNANLLRQVNTLRTLYIERSL